jgi:hypothetical protein
MGWAILQARPPFWRNKNYSFEQELSFSLLEEQQHASAEFLSASAEFEPARISSSPRWSLWYLFPKISLKLNIGCLLSNCWFYPA